MLDWIFHRWELKLLALALAFAVWIAVTGEGRGVQDYRVPVDIALGSGATLAGTPPTTVTVRLRGPETLLRRVDPYDVAVRVDLRDAAAGERTVQLAARDVSGVPRDVEVVLIDPERLRLTIARKVRKQIEVSPTIVGAPPRGYHVYGAIARPETLQVEGPEAKLAAVTRLKTDPIRVDRRSEPFVARVAAVADASGVRIVDTRPLDITVYVDLAPVQATIERVPVVVAGAGDGTVTVPSTISVRVSAPSSLIPKLRSGRVRAVAEVRGNGSADFLTAVPLRIEFPGLDAEERVKVEVKEMSRRTVNVRRSPR